MAHTEESKRKLDCKSINKEVLRIAVLSIGCLIALSE